MFESKEFLAMPGFYKFMFLYLEPLSTFGPTILLQTSGATHLHHTLVPTAEGPPMESLDSRTEMAIWQLANTYLLLCLISSFMFRAVRDSLPKNPVAQERIVGATLIALIIADATHAYQSWACLPTNIRYSPWDWNTMTHGNVTFVWILFLSRACWFLGVGRKRYWYGQPVAQAMNGKAS